MKVLQVYNQYRSLFNGEEQVVFQTDELLRSRGVQADLLMRSSREIGESIWRKAQAFFSGIYSRAAYRDMLERLDADRPDVVHVHNLYPLFSPSVLVACKERGVPVVMSLHNQNLTCPKSDHLRQGAICEQCTGPGREVHCVLKNCRGNLVESIGYAVRSAVARRQRWFHDNVTLLIALTRFAKRRLVENGFRPEQIVVLPNKVQVAPQPVDASQGGYIGFAGRLSPEKGVETLLSAAAQTPGLPIQLAGGGPLESDLQAKATNNVRLLGQLQSGQMNDFYRAARILVLPSTCFEMCPLVILEAMSHGIPVIASRIGGLGELVEDGVTGLLFEPGNGEDLAQKMQMLWNDPELCRRMGRAGYATAKHLFGEDAYFERLMAIYQRAQQIVASPKPHLNEPAWELGR